MQGWFDQNPVCTTLVTMGEVPIVREFPNDVDGEKIDAAVSAGLLSVEPFRQVPPFGKTLIDYRRCRPTDIGKATIRRDDRGLGPVDICFARRRIESVETFTEPADMAGIRLSRITYRYRLVDVAPWTDSAAIKAAVPTIDQILATPTGEATDTLVLTNEGWAHQRAR